MDPCTVPRIVYDVDASQPLPPVPSDGVLIVPEEPQRIYVLPDPNRRREVVEPT